MSTLSLLCLNPLPRCRFLLFPRIALFRPGPRHQGTAVGTLRALDRYGPFRGAGSTTREKGGVRRLSPVEIPACGTGVWIFGSAYPHRRVTAQASRCARPGSPRLRRLSLDLL